MKRRFWRRFLPSFGVFLYFWVLHLILWQLEIGSKTNQGLSVYLPCYSSAYFRNTLQDNGTMKEGFRKSKQIAPKHKIALLIPFRDCQEELQQFAPHIIQYLTSKGIQHRLYVINQIDDYRFNRAALINVGFLEMHSDCDYLAIHDVDHIPINPDLNYGYPNKGPFHVSILKYDGYVGGVLLMTNKHFRKVNGMSNDFWGWGKEDDDLYKRIRTSGLEVQQPLYTNSSLPYRLIHSEKRLRDKAIYFNQKKMRYILDMEIGLNTTRYTLHSRNITVVNGAPVWFINVRLHCNLRKTPFCRKKIHKIGYKINLDLN